MRLFTAIAAIKNYLILGADATNAYAQSPPPSNPTYLRIDDQYADLHNNKFGIELNKNDVLPVLNALQGHPDSGVLWAKCIQKVLTELNFKSTTHECCIYCGIYKEEEIFICCQVDNFEVTGPNEDSIRDVKQAIEGR
eukprot:14007603-Ditylum_brightwellii.AAC.1